MTSLSAISLFANVTLASGSDLLHSPAARGTALVIGIILLLAGSWGIYFLTELQGRRRTSKTSEPARGVFEELCERHNLSDREQQLMRDAAGELDLTSPSFVFVDSTLLGKLAASDHEHADEYRVIAERLFPPVTEGAESEQETLVTN